MGGSWTLRQIPCTGLAPTWLVSSGHTGWSSVGIDPVLAPDDVLASAFSHRDWRLWVVSDRPPGRRLIRLDPSTGRVVTSTTFPLLNGLEDMHLVTLDDGRVLLAGNTGAKIRLRLLSATPFDDDNAEIRVEGKYDVHGKLAMAPVVRHGIISLAIEKKVHGGGGPQAFVLHPVTVAVGDLQ